MVKIKGWIKYRDDPKRGSGWVNKEKGIEVRTIHQKDRNVWRVNVNNSKGGVINNAPSYFTEFKNKSQAEKVAIDYMKSVSGVKETKKQLSNKEKTDLLNRLYKAFRLDRMTQVYQNRIYKIFKMVEKGEITSVKQAKEYYKSLKPIRKQVPKALDNR